MIERIDGQIRDTVEEAMRGVASITYQTVAKFLPSTKDGRAIRRRPKMRRGTVTSRPRVVPEG